MRSEEFVRERRGLRDMIKMDEVDHQARCLLIQYQFKGVPVKVRDATWDGDKIGVALWREPHSSTMLHSYFLHNKFVSMIDSNQLVILPYSDVRLLKKLRISSSRVIPQWDKRPWWIQDYTYLDINNKTLPLLPTNALQYGWVFDRLTRQILLADPQYGLIYILKCSIADGYCCLGLCIRDIPELTLAFPIATLVLPMS